MHTLIISGSRNSEGRTALLIKSLQIGITRAGGTSECLFLPTLDLEHCRQCNADGWGICKEEDDCIIEDDFHMIVEKMDQADGLVFANPVYFHDLSESMKVFLDRLRRVRTRIVASPVPILPGPANQDQGQLAIGICYAGGSGNGTMSCCMNLEKALQFIGFDVLDMIPAKRQNLEAKLPIMEMVGKWLVTQPSSTKCELEPV